MRALRRVAAPSRGARSAPVELSRRPPAPETADTPGDRRHRRRRRGYADLSLRPEGQSRYAAAMIVVICLMVLLDWWTGNEIRLIGLAGLVTLSVAELCRLWQTALVVCCDLVASALVYLWLAPADSAETTIAALSSTALLGVTCLMLCRIRLQREALLARTVSVAQTVQRTILRELPIRAGPVRLSGFSVSSEGDALVGGDIYEAVQTPFGARVMIGDVQGKGLPAIGAGHAVLTAFREAAQHLPDLDTVAAQMERGLIRHNLYAETPGAERGRFVTALVLQVDADGRTQVVGCGHTPYYVIDGGTVHEQQLYDPGLPLGLGDLGGGPRPRQHAPALRGPDSWLLLCTDGITEARDASGAFYPLEERLRAWAGLPCDQVLDRLRADVVQHTGGVLRDDVTLLIVRRAGPGE